MSFNTIAYNNIEIKPYNLNSFQDLKIVKKLNEHGTIYFKGIVPEEEKDKYVEMTEVGTNLEVDCIDEASNRISLFKGVVTNIEIKMFMGIYYIEVEGMSHSYTVSAKDSIGLKCKASEIQMSEETSIKGSKVRNN